MAIFESFTTQPEQHAAILSIPENFSEIETGGVAVRIRET